MKVDYICRVCGDWLLNLEVNHDDEVRLGFASLTPEERADIIDLNLQTGAVIVRTFCGMCSPGADCASPVTQIH